MSLLMDALRRAEATQRQSTSGSMPADATDTQTLEPAQVVAKKVFEAKHAASRGNFYVSVGLFTLIAVIGIGIYFWWQLRPVSSLTLASGVENRTPALANPVAPSVENIHPQPPLPHTAQITPPKEIRPELPSDSSSLNQASSDEAQQPSAPLPHVDERLRESVAEKVTDLPNPLSSSCGKEQPCFNTSRPHPSPAIRITTKQVRLDPSLDHAYQALLSNDLVTAKQHYDAILSSDPHNVDAMLGLASISQRQGQLQAAEHYYLLALETNPNDTTAQAGLIALSTQTDPVKLESRLKFMLAKQPAASLHFALGNVYARQTRWPEAQQEYFRAYTSEPENPDYRFNLAVSLDQLHQPKLALQYYQGALDAASKHIASFDSAMVEKRVRELTR